ncbi:hypothetical protein [Mucilaginibacter celer]|uniref:Uncharacterized protein n=1 Tax=Mucilaginibacter celer TaxID=2305508 RepID=A0A494VMH8_9SPHI|nr:hypothetical protein [Mucilaginibacter celer]AYL95329.1 hypothetical protein HYN43_008480 [Mucilaginibacter celer]
MIPDQELNGKIVMMNPKMWAEHSDEAGVIGQITKADTRRDDFFVDYGGTKEHWHGANALLALRKSTEIYDLLRDKPHTLSVNDFKDLKNIALLLDYGTIKHHRTAMELVVKNEHIRDAATIRLDLLLGIDRQPGMER